MKEVDIAEFYAYDLGMLSVKEKTWILNVQDQCVGKA